MTVTSIKIKNCTVLIIVTVQIPPIILNAVTITPEIIIAHSSDKGVTTVINTPIAYKRTILSRKRITNPNQVTNLRTGYP